MLCTMPSPARSASSATRRASPTVGRSAELRYRERCLGERRAVGEGSGFGDEHVGFGSRVQVWP